MKTETAGSSAWMALIAICLVWFSSGYSEDTTPAAAADNAAWTIPSNDAIRKLLAERMQHNGVGVVVGVIEADKRRIVAHGRSGARDARPLDGDTVFQIGSVTKVFTGLLLADMVQRGEVKVDDPASKRLSLGDHLQSAEEDRHCRTHECQNRRPTHGARKTSAVCRESLIARAGSAFKAQDRLA